MKWYALRSKPNKEEALWRGLSARGHDVFYPRMRVQPVNPRARHFKPYFPGYLFVRADLPKIGLSTFSWLPHAQGLVSFGGEPAEVPDELILAIRRRVDEIDEAGGEQLAGLERGDAVVIHSGPFAGYTAIFDAQVDGNERVRVFLKLLQARQTKLELPAGQIGKIKRG